MPGKSFMPGARGEPCPYVRASYSLASPEKIDVVRFPFHTVDFAFALFELFLIEDRNEFS